MDIIIQSLDFTAKEDLKNFINQKVGALADKCQDAIRANVRLKLDKSDTGANKICEIRLEIPGNDLYASRQEHSFEEATQEVISALRKQIEKNSRQAR